MKYWQLLLAAIYGLCVMGSGMMRYLEKEDGEKGLWFGIVMGGSALAAAVAIYSQQRLVGNLLLWFSLTVTGGWFFYEALIKKGYADAEPRLLVILGLTALIAISSIGLSLLSSKTQTVAAESDAG